ncbi:type II toxin-antitoxin system VapC family toxin [Nitratifractor sp.]|uniref:type II toxin-antitoxin system VapC family toxin n=1 Tax=Nitratifractor sp. TaxID=2268144 RepID=UPI0025CF7E94|nr:type II toxin-antitoxin system VapC family toxin [Nitratifractor sp.]
MRRLFLDTNIILDFLDRRRAHHENAKALFVDIVVNEHEVVISEDMLSTVYYIHREKPKVLDFFETILEEWEVVPYGRKVIMQAIAFCRESGQDFEDTLQCLCAKENGCTYVVTQDRGFARCGVEIVDYAGYLESGTELFR